ncbi:retinoic acid receptor responder protein 1 [Sphaerodactylus townsendi]|uniref:retinoic acid receptor responder protein 1 n=1 Tax=Sphaerodactylus townsendi TaxID=933632 RepID=UPI0020264C74|nr:retinoic acid receptor responder protein 1 [Sphaerodactylus townsendi]
MQPLQASRLLLLGALLALLPAPARGVADRRPRVVWRHLRPSASADASSLAVRRAAQTAVNYFNFHQGSPNALRAPGRVKKVSIKTIPGVGRKYHLRFTTKSLLNGTNLSSCLASVFYLSSKPKPKVDIKCSPNQDRREYLLQDFILYFSLKGDKQPSVERLWGLGVHGSSLIAWEMATEDVAYTLTRIENVQPWKREDSSLEFNYNLQLSDVSAETSIYCHMRIVWKPGQPALVKYNCSSEDSSSDYTDGSGEEPGSAENFLISNY